MLLFWWKGMSGRGEHKVIFRLNWRLKSVKCQKQLSIIMISLGKRTAIHTLQQCEQNKRSDASSILVNLVSTVLSGINLSVSFWIHNFWEKSKFTSLAYFSIICRLRQWEFKIKCVVYSIYYQNSRYIYIYILQRTYIYFHNLKL